MMKSRRERGSSLPETAILLGILLVMVFGIVDFGRAMYTYAFVAQLARQGARWASVRGSQCSLLTDCNASSTQIQSYVQSLSEGLTTFSSITAQATWPASTCPPGESGKTPGCAVSVTVSYPFYFVTPMLPKSEIKMSSTSQMVISQ